MNDKVQNTKSFLINTSCIILASTFSVCLVLSFIFIIIFWQPPPTKQEKILIYILLAVFLLFILTVFLFDGTGTVTFAENRIIFKKWLFSHRRYFLYSEIDKIIIFYGYVPMGLRRAGGHCISIYRKKKKNPTLNIEITYPIVSELMKHTEGIHIRIGYSSLFKFSKKHRELLWDYLKESQKKEILRRLAKKKK